MSTEGPGNRVLVVRHGADPPDDRAFTYLHTRGFEPDVRCPYRGDDLGAFDDSLAGAIVHGGPFVVYETDQHPFLLDEFRLIEHCLERGLPLLGICQGAQSIAHVLGAAVGAPDHGQHEFGYYEIHPTDEGRNFLPASMFVTQAHFHGFEVPTGGTRLAFSDLYPNQAFRYGSAYGVQFHAEVTIEGFRRWQAASHKAYGEPGPGAQPGEEQTHLMLEHDARQGIWFYGLLESMFGSRLDDPLALYPR